MSTTAAQEEFAAARRWAEESFADAGLEQARFPLSFRYGDQESPQLFKSWETERSEVVSGPGVTRQTLTLTDLQTGLQCRCERPRSCRGLYDPQG